MIAAGTRPLVPNIPGLASVPYYTSDDVMRLPVQPRRMAIVGGGYIAAEMGHFFGSLGTEVTFMVRSGAMVREEDAEISKLFTEIYQGRFNVLLNTRMVKVSKSGEAIRIETDKGDEVECDVLLLAAGRVPNSDVLEVARTGVEVDERGYVQDGRVHGDERTGYMGAGRYSGPLSAEALGQSGVGVCRQQYVQPGQQGPR